MDKLKITFDGLEIAAFCLMVKQASDTTYTDPNTKKAMVETAARIKYAVRAQAPAFSHILEDMGDF